MTDPLLYGRSSEENIVAVQQVNDSTMRVYTRSGEAVSFHDEPFYPFFFLSDISYLKGFQDKYWHKVLEGNLFYRHICAFPRVSLMWDAVNHILERYNDSHSASLESYTELPVVYLRPDTAAQFLLQSGKSLFKGMTFDDLYRMQIDIETYTAQGFRFSNASRREDKIIAIAISDNRGWQHIVNGQQLSEQEMLLSLIKIINQKDPDVIEGHNIYQFDIPYLLQRCNLYNIEFGVGRDGSVPHSFDVRSSFAERSVDFVSYQVAGRHIIDTWLLLQSYDVSKRTLESYSLKYAAKHFGLAKEDRIYLNGDRISWYWDNEPDLLLRYAGDDVYETRLLSEILSPATFYLSQLVPFNYGTLARLGSAVKIESLLVREYVRQKHSIPAPRQGTQTTGGYTDVYHTGILGPILHVDVESLYPSIMLTNNIAPSTDVLNIFQQLLKTLTTMRLEAKKRLKSETDPSLKSKHDALQSSYKILINSFYGYLGYMRALFNDFDAAEQVTQTGQSIIKELMNKITELEGIIVEVDTDGIYFVPPPYVKTQENEQHFVGRISSSLPQGINLAISGRYQKMLSYKKKNYALLDYENKILLKGSSLISRSLEKYCRSFIHQCIDALMNNNIAGLHELYVSLRRDIAAHAIPITELARTETLKDSLEVYISEVESQRRNRSASYEVALTSGIQWKAGDRISYYITGNDPNVKEFEYGKLVEEWDPHFPDENIAFYLKRLDEVTEKFEPFFLPKDFRTIFTADTLFEFSPEGITIQTTHIARQNEEREQSEQDVNLSEPGISLDEA